MKNISILHKITGRIGDFHDLHLPILKFAQWFIILIGLKDCPQGH